MRDVSILIPIYNVEDYLPECLDSVINQTHQNMEIICIDDCSKDKSSQILHEYEEKDDRIKAIYHTTNTGVNQVRKECVELATGKYILFLDADDYYCNDTVVSKLYHLMEKKDVDILQFGSVVDQDCLSKIEYEKMLQWLEPYDGKITGENILSDCFLHEKYRFSLWNKMYRGDLVRKAFSYVKEERITIAEDAMAYFFLSFFAETYYGTSDIAAYHYRYGYGITSKKTLNLEQFKHYCEQSVVIQRIDEFLTEQNKQFGIYRLVYQKIKENFLHNCIFNWLNKVDGEVKAKGFKVLINAWKVENVVSAFAKMYWYGKKTLVRNVTNSDFFQVSQRKVKVIGIYYHRMTNGGVEKVISSVIPLWIRMGYQIVLITDFEATEKDYPIPSEVRRVTIQPYTETTEDNYIERAMDISKIIKEYHIDTVIYHAWNNPILFWDLCIIKGNDCRFVVQTHSIFTCCYDWLKLEYDAMPYVFELADTIVSTTRVDQKYWSAFNNNAFYIQNPIEKSLNQIQTNSKFHKAIIWAARFDKNKRPFDAINIMELVVKEIPDAKLLMVGTAETKEEMKQYYDACKEKKLTKNIIFTGYQSDVSRYYKQASVNLITSEMEGFSMVLLESKAHGIPSVMYELEYLEMVRDNRGLLLAPIGGIYEMANHIINLLNDSERYECLSRQARESFEEIASYDQKAEWSNVFESLNQGRIPRSDNDFGVLMHHVSKTLSEFTKNESCQVIERVNHDAEIVCGQVINSYSFKIGRAITWLPRSLRDVLKKILKH